jgi:alkylated DNA repair dioxygenase AlkB
MDLFNTEQSVNILPLDGTAIYYGKILNNTKANHYYQTLLSTIDWKNDEAIIFGKKIITNRKVAWYGQLAYSYTYSKTTKFALPFTDELLELKELTENITKTSYNSCLLNLYHNGTEGMAWHSDGEKMLQKNGSIASLSFGAERRFCFKHKINQQKIELVLESGSLLEMKNETQSNWLHRLPTAIHVKQPRINLTFRTIEIKKAI